MNTLHIERDMNSSGAVQSIVRAVSTGFQSEILRVVTLYPILVIVFGMSIVHTAFTEVGDSMIVTVDFAGYGDNSCDSLDSSPESDFYVGGMYQVDVTLLPGGVRPTEIEYTGVSDWTWPHGLILRTRPEQLAFEYFVMETEVRDDSVWRATGWTPLFKAPIYHFAFLVPPELAGTILCIEAEWNHPQYGHIASEHPDCVRILRPCSHSAERSVLTSRVHEASQQRKFDLAIELADSFLTTGWHDFYGLVDARRAATAGGRYDDAIRLLDTCFELNHATMYAEGWKPTPSASEEEHHLYQRIRAHLIELRSQQQQR